MEEILTQLNPEQKKAVLHTDGPLLVLAVAGTGKTRVVTHRIAYLLSKGISPEKILAVTFTNKAAGEMKNRVEKLSPEFGKFVWVSTFHSFGAKLLRIESKNIGLHSNFVIYDETDQKNLIKSCLKELNIDDKKFKIGIFHEIISRAKDDLIDSESYMIHSSISDEPFRQLVSSVYSLYQKKLTEASAVDFGDLLLKLVEMLKKYPELEKKYQQRFDYVLVDEYQDTNRAQSLLIKHLVEKHGNICVVGDDDQAIYSWRGARVTNILGFEKEYPGTKVIKLEENYRSTKNILDCAWQVVKNNQYRKNKHLRTKKQQGEDVDIRHFSNEIEESDFVVREIDRLCGEGKYSYSDFAVFYRINAQSRVLEDAFRRNRIPYRIIGTVKFYERAEIKDIIAYIRVVVNPKDVISLKRIINVPHRGIGSNTIKILEQYAIDKKISLWNAVCEIDNQDIKDRKKKSIKKFIELIQHLMDKKNTLPAEEFVKHVIEKTGYAGYLKDEGTYLAKEKTQNLKELISAVAEFELSEKDNSIESFLNNISLIGDIDNLDSNDGQVTLMTIHLAKGLEFPSVFITGLEEGLFPISFYNEISDFSSELEEERRVCYVGMTRAKEKLYLTYAETRRLFGRGRTNIPSRFLREAQAQVDIKRHEVNSVDDNMAVMVSSKSSGENEYCNSFRIGHKIRHTEFGEGRIIRITGDSENTKLTILFGDGESRKLLAKYANLEKI